MERKRIKGLPREAKPGEWVAIDSEFFKQVERFHRPGGLFACATFSFEDETYMITDVHDLKESLERVSKGQWIIQNSPYDLRQFKRWVDIQDRPIWDTMLVEQTLFGGYYNSFSLNSMARRYMDIFLEKETRDDFSDRESMTHDMEEYSFLDPEITYDVALAQKKYTEDNMESMDHYWKYEAPMVWVVLDMPGTRVDTDAWAKAVEGFEQKAKELQDSLGINVKSVKQKRELLTKLTGTDWSSESTAKEVLEDLALKHAGTKIADVVKKIREATQMRDMSGARYGAPWLEKYVEEDGLVHASWKIIGADMTGRMASADPNLQNIPIRDFPIYRSFFVPSAPGNIFLDYDAMQQEPRITAHFSRDKALLEAIFAGEDLHQYAADGMAELLGRTVDRRIGKAINLGVTYGETEYGLSYRLNCSVDQALEFLNAYFARFSGVAAWIDTSRRSAKRLEYVRTATGRKCWVNPYAKGSQNNAINSPVQGTAATHIKASAINNRAYSKILNLPFRVNLMVHDELVMDVPAGMRDVYTKIIKESMMDAWHEIIPDVPLALEGGAGRNWLEAKEAGKHE